MKSTTLLPFLCVLAAALPATINHNREPDAHHFAPVTRIHPSTIEQDLEAPIDNRPQNPSTSDIPSVILASQKPIQSTYLLGLPRAGNDEDEPATKPAALGSEPLGDSSDGHETQTQAQKPTQAHAAHPCVSRQHVDIAVICFVALFLLAVVAVESKESIWSYRTAHDVADGAIRLDTEAAVSAKQFSVQAWAYSDGDDNSEAEKARL
ncbi:hypothetical protein MCOR27_011687 [Pyricularia oryzae]|uniref:Uncharacterized protein n=2 Tax=Pyricularia TaxID=48558 RepID=A0ABQ8N2G1_PYRGI|nr:hypothetical protein MCOR01_005167 [Pyricularia oryzae]KAI6290111.1 hypothetical protein MCOR33_011511 [Pyricularia grisea]KAI6251601.1 hypothetical protein MCOR19_011758 [Pyricularia oryzae]KAI6264542.1 hypothetical protein MCOR26_011272 [Pyricularia oryzae]KAI6264560.1 hypothetical protein MCOR27_011687 [Pyricularia oryzae]